MKCSQICELSLTYLTTKVTSVMAVRSSLPPMSTSTRWHGGPPVDQQPRNLKKEEEYINVSHNASGYYWSTTL